MKRSRHQIGPIISIQIITFLFGGFTLKSVGKYKKDVKDTF